MLAFTISESMWSLMIVQVIGLLTLLIKSIMDGRMRVQDRLDREQLAKLTLDQLEEVKKAGNDRLVTLVGEVQKVKSVTVAGIRASAEALRVANGHNEKIAALTQKIGEVQQVEVVNSADHPVPVESSNHPTQELP